MPVFNLALEELECFTEGQTGFLEVEFFDEDGEPLTPTKITYRVDDLLSGSVLISETEVSPPAPGVTIELDPDTNMIINPELFIEVHVLTVVALYAEDRQAVSEYYFIVENQLFYGTA